MHGTVEDSVWRGHTGNVHGMGEDSVWRGHTGGVHGTGVDNVLSKCVMMALTIGRCFETPIRYSNLYNKAPYIYISTDVVR